MKVKSFTVNPFFENTYIVHDETRAALIDPGFSGAAERAAAVDYLRQNGLELERLLLTHAHIDHIIDCAYWADTHGMQFDMHEADLPLLKNARQQALIFGVEMHDPPLPTSFLSDGDVIAIGDSSWRVIEAPGHSPGSICFYEEDAATLIGGDVLFAGSIGRTDLWRGSFDVLIESIKTRILTLPDETVVYTGHGEQTTVGRERTTNPFLLATRDEGQSD